MAVMCFLAAGCGLAPRLRDRGTDIQEQSIGNQRQRFFDSLPVIQPRDCWDHPDTNENAGDLP
jgi:hypothetical protein